MRSGIPLGVMPPKVSGVPHWGWGGGLKSNLRQPMIREAKKLLRHYLAKIKSKLNVTGSVLRRAKEKDSVLRRGSTIIGTLCDTINATASV